MKEVPLTKGYVALVSNKDHKRVSAYKWCATVDRRKDGSIYTVYAMRRERREDGTWKNIKMHRFILEVDDNAVKIDHKDHNGLNNQRRNIRLATDVQNQGNASMRIDNKSGFRGVRWYAPTKKWAAAMTVRGKGVHLGYFSDILEAARAYKREALKRFGKFSNEGVLNES